MKREDKIKSVVKRLREQGFIVEIVGDDFVISKGGRSKTIAIDDFLDPNKPLS